MNANAKEPPQIFLQQLSVELFDDAGHWNVAWQVINRSPGPIRLLAVRLPHGQFKGEESRFDPAIDLAPGEQGKFVTRVRCVEPPGLVTENAFVIFYVHWRGDDWRIFVRIRVIVSSNREPETVVELISTQPVGFSGISG